MDKELLARHFLIAYHRGRTAFRESGVFAECPYVEHGNSLFPTTWSSSYIKKWHEGIMDEMRGSEDRYEVKVAI